MKQHGNRRNFRGLEGKNDSVARLKKVVLVTFSSLAMLSLGNNAKASTISFEGLTPGSPLLDQYESQGVYFRDQLSLSGGAPGVVVANGYSSSNSFQANQANVPFYVLFTTPFAVVNFVKWETSMPRQQPTEQPTTEAPTESVPTEEYTVYLEFYKKTGETYQVVGSTFNSTKDNWTTVSFASNEPISAIKIYGDTVDNQAYYIDNIQTLPVPEPESYAMMMAGLGLMGFMARRKKSA